MVDDADAAVEGDADAAKSATSAGGAAAAAANVESPTVSDGEESEPGEASSEPRETTGDDAAEMRRAGDWQDVADETAGEVCVPSTAKV
jgi:hypothetical protein